MANQPEPTHHSLWNDRHDSRPLTVSFAQVREVLAQHATEPLHAATWADLLNEIDALCGQANEIAETFEGTRMGISAHAEATWYGNLLDVLWMWLKTS